MLATLELLQPDTASDDEVTAEDAARARSLGGGEEREALDFLSARPLHTVYMSGLIRDNGLRSQRNRGTFYGCRDTQGRLTGVALIGHVTQVEARTPTALRALARAAQACSSTHVIMGEQSRIRAFWKHYGVAGQPLRLACRELLFVQAWPVEACDSPAGLLRRATAEDLALVMPAQAGMAVEECGVNPLEIDPQGFRERCASRIERGRIWVSVGAGDSLDFKADVMSETPEAAYLEGVYVRPGARGLGLGRRCMLQLTRELLAHTRAVCLLVNESNLRAQSFYRNIGFSIRGLYETIYLHKNDA